MKTGPATLNDREAVYQALAPLVNSMIRKFAYTAEERKDLEREIYLRFAQLYAEYDPSRGVPLIEYLVKKLYLRVWNHVRYERRYHGRHLQFTSSVDEREDFAHDPTSSYEQRFYMETVSGALRDAVKQLAPAQALVIKDHYLRDPPLSVKDLAKRLGVEPATVRSNIRHAIKRIRVIFKQQGLN